MSIRKGNTIISGCIGMIGSVSHDSTLMGSGTIDNPLGVNTTNFATASQGAKADTAIQPSDNISELTNDSGFITKSVNDLTNYTLSSSLSTVATSGSYNDLSNKPTIPTKTSDLTNDGGFITKAVNNLDNYTLTSGLGDLATQNSVNYETQVTNKPTISTVNDAVLTIQKNGVNVATFSANSSTNKTANISVPTQASDILTSAQQNAVNSGANSTNIGQIATNQNNISTLQSTKANVDASNITSSNVTSWHTKLNDMATPTAGQTQTGKQAVVVDSYLSSDGKTWYRKWSDGWKECGSSIYIGSASTSPTTLTITLPIRFNRICTGNASVKLDQNSSGDARAFGTIGNYTYGSSSTTIEVGIGLSTGSGSSLYAQYEVRGY